MIAATLIRPCGERVRLLGSRCATCGDHAFPARRICAACTAGVHEPVELSGAGTLRGFTAVQVPPAGFAAPYLLATVDLHEGPRVLGPLLSEPAGSDRVVAIPHPVRDGEPGFAFDFGA
jgi:uncharacterized OB-fold protein